MIKLKLLSALLLWFTFSTTTFADQTKLVKLDNKEHKKETIALPFCNLFVEITDIDEDNYSISVKMENISENKILILFDRAYSEKTLKKMYIQYDKVFQGTKGKRFTEGCDGISKSIRFLPSETNEVVNLKGSDNTIKLRLPIYLARFQVAKNGFIKNKIQLAQKEVIELNIDVELKPDEEYIQLSEATNKLLEEIDKQVFCSNQRHVGNSYKALIEIFEESIVDLIRQIQNVISSRGYMSTDKGYKKFMELYNTLNVIKLEDRVVTSCGNDKARTRASSNSSGHKCKYCDVSYNVIYNKLESYYIDLYNGKKNKSQIIGDVELLYNCAIKNKKRSGNSNYLSRIKTYYKKITAK